MKQQINSLTASRAIAALLVYIFHFGRDIFPFNHFLSNLSRGNIAVSYFYTLSGFVLYISHINKHEKYSHFLLKRVARIAPAYVLALVLFSLFFLCICKNPFILNTKGLVFLGEISYGFYILQFPVAEYAWYLNTTYIHASEQVFFFSSVVLLFLISALSYYLLELPARKRIRKYSEKKRNPESSGKVPALSPEP
jgi:peptidoglycan/LPS O-acetylase OafA/YrhL